MASKAAVRRFQLIYDMGCVVCWLEGFEHEPCQIHHLVDEGNRELSGGDMATIGLCPWHHDGQPKEGIGLMGMYKLRGPSLRRTSSEFNERWPQRMLLDHVNGQLSMRERNMVSICR